MADCIKRIEYNCMIPQGKKHTVKGEKGFCSAVILKSLCKAEISGKVLDIFPDSVILLPENESLSFVSENNQVFFDGFLFSGREDVFSEPTVIEDIACGELSASIKEMKIEQFDERLLRGEICRAYADIFFMKLDRLKAEKETRHKVHAFYKIREDIYNQPYKNWKIDDLIAGSGLSRRQFYYTWRAVFKNTPLQDILNSRIEYAKTLLTTTEMRISEITAACNFSSDQYFIQTFKKRVGVPPSKFRFDFVRFTNLDQRT